MRRPENRNRPGGDMTETFLFNEAISALRLVELPLHGRKYTWTNKQHPPLLERLDWFFTSNSWTLSYRTSAAWALNMETSDHVPCVIKISTDVPKTPRFRFENYLMEHEQFLAVVQHGWGLPTVQTDTAKRITEKFKNLRRVLKAWHSQLSSLKQCISNVKLVLTLMEFLEDFRHLSLHEWSFKLWLKNYYPYLNSKRFTGNREELLDG